MKIAYFCDTFEPQINGVSMTLKRLSQYAESNHIETIFLVPSYPGATASEGNVYRFSSFPLIFYKDCRVAIPPLFKAERLLDEFKPDIIHAYSEFSLSLAAIRYAQKHKIPIVSSYTSNFTTYLHYYNLNFLSPCLEAYLKWFHNSCKVTFCPSERTKKYLFENDIKRTSIMKRGVDFSRFSPSFRSPAFRQRIGAKENAIVFTYVGRISPEKDLDILTESIKQIKRRYGERAAFVIVGDGPYLSHLKSDLGDMAYFTGFLKGNGLSEAYASSDVFVFPSTSETFGNVVLEAMCSGLPAIVPNSGGVAEIITDKHNGFVVAPRDINAFSTAISGFIQNPELIAEMRKQAILSAQNWSWENVFNRLFDCYQELIEDGSKYIRIKLNGEKRQECAV